LAKRPAQNKSYRRRIEMASEPVPNTDMSRFVWQEGDIEVSLCGRCKHKHLGAGTCDAYPEGIPFSFASGADKHTVPVPGDMGIIFEAV
jgi:hypothetical protein